MASYRLLAGISDSDGDRLPPRGLNEGEASFDTRQRLGVYGLISDLELAQRA